MRVRIVNRCIFAAAFLGCLLVLGNVFWREYLKIEYHPSDRTGKFAYLSPSWVRFPYHFPTVAVVHERGERVEVHNVLRYLYARWRWYEDTEDARRDGQGVERYFERLSPRMWDVCIRMPEQRIRMVPKINKQTWAMTERPVPTPQFQCRFLPQLPPSEGKEYRELANRGKALIATRPSPSRGQ